MELSCVTGFPTAVILVILAHGMAEKPNTQHYNLQALKNQIEYNQLTGDEVLSFVTHVMHVSRYLSDPLHISQTGLDTANVIDVYQLTVTDGQSKRKVLLDPELAIIVQSGQIKEGSSIRLENCSVKYDETDLQLRTFVIVHKLTQLDDNQLNLTYSDCTDMPWCDDCDDVEKSSVPLSSSRGYFLNTWSSMEMEGDVWKKGNPEMYNELGDFTAIDFSTIREISLYWRSLKCPPILVKILSKKRVVHYAKPFKDDKWPLQFNLTVCDRSGCATLVLWNSLCPEYYQRLQEGDILLIQKFTVKKSYQPIDNKKCKHTIPDHLKMYDIDINVNSHHPVGEIRVISPTAVPACLNLPTIQYKFVQRKDMGLFPSNYMCDITGVVTHVGRFNREKITGRNGKDLGGFWIRRWLELRDHTSSKPIIINIYRAAEINVHDQIHPGMVIILRHMRIVHDVCQLTSSREKRTVYLTSTVSTCVSKATDDFVSHHVEDVVAWAASRTLDYTMGGYYSYPTLPTSLSEFTSNYEGLHITTSDYVQCELDTLSYREQKRVFIQCKMVYVKYYSATNRIEELTQDDMVVDENLYKYFKEEITEREIKSPYIYKYDEQHIHGLLQFPSLFSNVKESDLDLADGCSGCFIIFWSGLNTKVLLPTIWMYNDVVTQENRLKNMLSHSCKSLQRNQALSQEEITQILASSKECDSHRFLVVLDVFKSKEKQTEIVLNTAYNT